MLVARAGRAAATGIDLERVGRIDAGLWPSVFTPAEMHALRGLPPAASTVLFGAKEAVQKARYALTGAWIELSGLRLNLDWSAGRFTLPGVAQGIGRFTVDSGLVLSTYVIDLLPRLPFGLAAGEGGRLR